jgi:hypothetical protein
VALHFRLLTSRGAYLRTNGTRCQEFWNWNGMEWNGDDAGWCRGFYSWTTTALLGSLASTRGPANKRSTKMSKSLNVTGFFSEGEMFCVGTRGTNRWALTECQLSTTMSRR